MFEIIEFKPHVFEMHSVNQQVVFHWVLNSSRWPDWLINLWIINAFGYFGEKMKIYLQVLTLSIYPQIWLFQVVVLQTTAKKWTKVKSQVQRVWSYCFCPLNMQICEGLVAVAVVIVGSLSMRVFEMRTATGREHFAFQDSGVSQIFILIISNG